MTGNWDKSEDAKALLEQDGMFIFLLRGKPIKFIFSNSSNL